MNWKWGYEGEEVGYTAYGFLANETGLGVLEVASLEAGP